MVRQTKPALTVTIRDMEIQTFRSGGKGGQNQNKRDTGVRLIHHPSGARAESREHRTQGENKKAAFRKVASSYQFLVWAKDEMGLENLVNEHVNKAMHPGNLRVDYRIEGRWVTTP